MKIRCFKFRFEVMLRKEIDIAWRCGVVGLILQLVTTTFFLGIEEKFKVKIPDEDIDALDTIDSIITYTERF